MAIASGTRLGRPGGLHLDVKLLCSRHRDFNLTVGRLLRLLHEHAQDYDASLFLKICHIWYRPATLREEHYPFWSQGRLKTVLRVDLVARSTRDAVPGSLDVFDKADQNDATAKMDALSQDTALEKLFVGKLAEIDLPPSPVSGVQLFFEDKEIDDLWVAVTWGK